MHGSRISGVCCVPHSVIVEVPAVLKRVFVRIFRARRVKGYLLTFISLVRSIGICNGRFVKHKNNGKPRHGRNAARNDVIVSIDRQDCDVLPFLRRLIPMKKTKLLFFFEGHTSIVIRDDDDDFVSELRCGCNIIVSTKELEYRAIGAGVLGADRYTSLSRAGNIREDYGELIRQFDLDIRSFRCIESEFISTYIHYRKPVEITV